MTVIGLDDTDSRERGMCTTYLAARVAERVEAAGANVTERLLVRLNPAVKHKTRGNAALAIHTDLDVGTAADIAREELTDFAETADERTSPGLVVAPVGPIGERAERSESVAEPPQSVVEFARDAIREFHEVADARSLLADLEWTHEGWSGHPDTPAGRGCIGALAAVGAAWAFEKWTYEGIAYREFERCGSQREVDYDSVFAAAEAGYPAVWDTVDRGEGEAVCVPSAPGPILYGIRGDDPEAIRAAMARIESEPVERRAMYRTNQGTDAHLRDADAAGLGLDDLQEGHAYRVTATVTTEPETRRGGHVFVGLAEDADQSASIDAAAFEPTKRFRERVRALRPGDRLTVCGEVAREAIKLEKFAVRSLVRTESRTPVCPECGNTMESAGRGQGYRCRDCGTTAPGKVEEPIERDLEPGWYEVPPCARRHIAKPLIRGGFDAPVHPER